MSGVRPVSAYVVFVLPVSATIVVQFVSSVLRSILYPLCWSPVGWFQLTVSATLFTIATFTLAGGVGSVGAVPILLSPDVP